MIKTVIIQPSTQSTNKFDLKHKTKSYAHNNRQIHYELFPL